MSKPYQLLLIGDSDSQLLACEALCNFPEDLTVEITINAIPREGTPAGILQRAENLGTLWRHDIGSILNHPDLYKFDAIGVYLTGSKISDFRSAMDLLPRINRPILFCGFNGVILEKFIEGMSWRVGYDLICLSGQRDLEACNRMLKGTPYEQQATVLTGLKRNSSATEKVNAKHERRKQLVFAEQVVMPRDTKDRAEMIRILAGLAKRSPQWDVLIKPRIAPNESTFHQAETHISQTIFQTLGHPPENFHIDYRSLPELLSESRLMATVSSTAFFDALDFGCRPVALADFGINPANGSHVFAGSGAWVKLDSIPDLDVLDETLKRPKKEWLEWMGYGKEWEPGKLIHALQDLKREAHKTPSGQITGYMTNSSLSFTQIRRKAEEAILQKNWHEAESLLKLGCLMRPTHRNVARRLKAVQHQNRLLRRLWLALTHRKLR